MVLDSGARLGPYKILAPLGKGGMGEVYCAKDTRLDREVAIKVLPEHLAQDADALKRFEREAKAVAALSHPNILTIHDVGSEQGVSFAVMELLEGETLRTVIAGKPVPWRKAVEVASAVAEGLAAAHSKGVIHRDLKPENIFLTSDDRVKILDFGLARYKPQLSQQELTEAPTESKLTESGIVMGTVPYMSPEQVRGESVDASSDIFSLGCVLHEMITGKRAFHRDTSAETISAILRDEPPELPDNIPPELSQIISHCLEKNSAKRFHSAYDLVFALTSVLSVGRVSVPASQVASGDVRPTIQRRIVVTAIIAMALLVAGYVILSRRKQAADEPGQIRSIAVLPLKNLSGDPKQEYFSDGMTEELITTLARIELLRVTSRTSVMKYKNTGKTVPEIARELRVDGVLEGSVLQAGDRVRITVQLIHAATDKHLWAESYEKDLRNILALQNEVARSIAGQIQINLTADEKSILHRSRPVSPEAYQLYLKGRYFWNLRTEEGLRHGLEHFNQAIEEDHNYALAHAGVALTYALLGHELYCIMDPRESDPKAKAAALRALELDETCAEAHAVLAWSNARYDWNWAAVEREYKRAIELNPSSATARQWYSHYLLPMGRVEESLAESRRALELDPLNRVINMHLGWHYLYVRDYGQAVRQLRLTLELAPDFALANMFLGQAYEQMGRFEEAIMEFQKGVRLSARKPVHLAALAHAYAVSGRQAEAQKLLEELKELSKLNYVPSYEVAVIYAGLNQKEQALKWLERAHELRDSSWLPCVGLDPRFENLRGEPRFRDLMRRLGLPLYDGR